jgi:alkanesulfonate monooxygenase SsuD/methylene tetrahydromethanopterin reductase-like flavin-dependent oxidoreductase (luciferase family)
MSFADIFRGARGLMQPPIDDIETYWTPQEKAQAGQMLSCSVIGSRETVREGLTRLFEETGADEFMIVSDVFDPAKRLRSLEIIAQAMA